MSLWTLTERMAALYILTSQLDRENKFHTADDDHGSLRFTGSEWACVSGRYKGIGSTPEDAIVATLATALAESHKRVREIEAHVAEMQKIARDIADAHNRCNAARYE